MEEKLTDKNAGIRFLYKAMVERDPSKRRVKPVEKNLQLLDFGDLEDSSDDSDFNIGEHENDNSEDDTGDSNKDNSDDDEDEEDSDEKEVEKTKKRELAKNIIPKKEPKVELEDIMSCGSQNLAKNNSVTVDDNDVKLPKLSVGELIDRAIHRQSQVKQRVSGDNQSKHLKVLICCVCLGDVSEGNDEIVECDCCGITVHEAGCYGISDTDTAVSNASSSSTEPWFCDACKAGNMSPICELCPNSGGIFKETDVGRWVHLVCALYISGVAFGDVDKLSPVTLFEMPYSRWGAKACTLCEDDRFCRTGVCISCDAGMCRSYFHVTCAQREGLLSEASHEEIADPFFAYCKVHAVKGVIRNKRCNWFALQSQTKENRLESMPPSEEKSRIERKLAWHREKYAVAQASKPPPWVPTQKMPRLLTSSATAYRRLMRKSELMGLSPQTYLSSTDTMIDIRKKWHIPVAFSVEFVGYYLDRNTRMTSMQKRLDELLQQNSQLQEQEQTIRTRYDKLCSELDGLQAIGKPLMDIGTKLHTILCDIGNKKLALPEVLQKKQPPKSPSSKNSRRSDHSTSVISECGICHRSNDQHFLAKCDKCTLHYHLQCLDPPLSRMPKKTKSQGWQCSECDKTEEDDKDDNVDPNAPRRLRDHSRENKRGVRNSSPVSDCSKVSTRQSRLSSRKATLESQSTINTSSEIDDTGDSQLEDDKDDKNGREKITLSIKKGRRKMAAASSKDNAAAQRRRGNARKRKLRETVADEKEVEKKVDKEKDKESPTAAPAPKSSRTLLPRKTKSETKLSCCRCGESGETSNLVKCDECKKCYHLHCLRPPVKKSPKQRGYTWHCEDCDSSTEDTSLRRGKSNKSSAEVTSPTKDEEKLVKS